MKKLFFALAACAAMVACHEKGKTAAASVNDSTVVDSICFQGEVPAADGPGVRYELALAGDSTNGFRLTETYLEAENGKDQVNTFSGVAEVIEKDVNGQKKKAYKLAAAGATDASYFLVVNDSVLRMVNAELEEAASGLNYDLKLVK